MPAKKSVSSVDNQEDGASVQPSTGAEALSLDGESADKPCRTNVICHADALPEGFAKLVQELERLIGMPVWLLVQQTHQGTGAHLDFSLLDAFFEHEDEIDGPIALLIESPGGQAKAAYQLATFLRERCGEWTAVVPLYGKSAATL
jgi:hypothetical protein